MGPVRFVKVGKTELLTLQLSTCIPKFETLAFQKLYNLVRSKSEEVKSIMQDIDISVGQIK